MEWDSLVVIPEFKLVINVEVKRGPSSQKLREASIQTEQHFLIFRKVFGSLLSPQWDFVKAACMPNLELKTDDKSKPCGYCKQYILKESHLIDIKPWIKKLLNIKAPQIATDPSTDYESLIAGLIGFMSVRKASELSKLIVEPIDHGKRTATLLVTDETGISGENDKEGKTKQILDKIDPVDSKNIIEQHKSAVKTESNLCYILNTDQLNAVMSPSRYLVIDGDYGTGKTYVLKERAKSCSVKNKEKRIAYITLTNCPVSGKSHEISSIKSIDLMDLIAENDFKNYGNVKVIRKVDLITYCKYDEPEIFDINLMLEKFLKDNPYDHVFIDELEKYQRLEDEIPDFFQHSFTLSVTMKIKDKQDKPGKV